MTGIVLAGGESRRFGGNKALARVGGRRLIDLVVELHRTIFDEVIVVSTHPIEEIGLGCAVAADVLPRRGPLAGLATGLLHARRERAFVTACDMPFLNGALLSHLGGLAPGKDIVVPVVGGRAEPLHAVYARSCLPHVLEALDRGAGSLVDFYPAAGVREVGETEIRRFDPELLSFFNVNTTEDLERARVLLEPERRPTPERDGAEGSCRR